MRIHSDIIRRYGFRIALIESGISNSVFIDTLEERRSHKRAKAFEIKLLTTHKEKRKRLRNTGTRGEENTYPEGYFEAATRNEYGKFIAALYRVDSNMIVDNRYENEEEFHFLTEGKYR